MQVLIIDSDKDYVERLLAELRACASEELSVRHVANADDGMRFLGRRAFDVVLMDPILPDVSGFEMLDQVMGELDAPPPVVVWGRDSRELMAGGAVARGAQDYIVKGEDSVARIWRSLSYAIERHRIANRLRFLASHDVLTGLVNRPLYFDRLGHALRRAARNKGMLAVMYLDLDGFKSINDGLGHEFGDQVLQAVGRRLSACLRHCDTLARLGGDEFGVIAEDLEAEESAYKVAGHMLERVHQPFAVNPHSVCVTVSIGVAVYPHDGEDPQSLLKHADQAMYIVKRRGGLAAEGKATL